MVQQGQYTGEVVSSGWARPAKPKFNWPALVVWLISLPISLIPIYIVLVEHLIQNNGAITNYFWLACFKNHDVLWVFATVLLFSCMNHFTVRKRAGKSKGLITALRVLGGLLFLLLETTWIIFKYVLVDYQPWTVWLGAGLSIAAMIIATPLQIDFIKIEG